MRKALVFGLLLVALSSFAAPTTIKILYGGYLDAKDCKILVDIYALRNPDVVIDAVPVDMSDGSTLTMDAMTAAGTPPDLYVDFMGRTAKYITPEFAFDIAPYITDKADFLPGILDMTTRSGKLLGIAFPSSAQGMAINMKLAKAIGATEKSFKNWTVDDFLAMARKVKALNNGSYATGLFAGNQSGDYLWMNWMASFGARMYAPGDYSKTVINTPAGLQFFTFLQGMVKQGYAEANSAVLTDDDYALTWAKGKYLATGWFPGWIPVYFKAVKDQKLGGADFDVIFVPFPKATGVKAVPAAGSMPGGVVHNGPDMAKNIAAAKFLDFLASGLAQEIYIYYAQNAYPNRKSASVYFSDPWMSQCKDIVAANGMLDLGITLPQFAEIRAQGFPELQGLYTNKKTPAQALASYEANVNKILARK
jgi:ABC-type glycerol-3-phosphate transport system substrate-binding protein